METNKESFLKRNPIVKFVRESIQELKKVVWPKKREVINKASIVVVSIIVAASLLGAIDYGLSQGIKLLINIK